jgi:DNA-binding transcriptional LysR family regulator
MRELPSLNALRVFEEVARHSSFSRAALALNVTQGAVSRQIRQLEDYLGVALFVRTPQGLGMTPAGSALVPGLTDAFDRMQQALREVRVPNLRQRLRILAPPTYATRWLSPRLKGFHKRYPDIALNVRNDAGPESPSEIDCRIRFGKAPAQGWHSRLLLLERHLAVAAPELFEAGRPPVLAAHPLLHILHEGKHLQVWENWLEATGCDAVDPSQGLEFSTLDQVIHAALAGGGLAVIDRRMIEYELATGQLLPISPVEVEGPYGYWLDVPASSQGLSKVSVFCEWIEAQSATQAPG